MFSEREKLWRSEGTLKIIGVLTEDETDISTVTM
jgi:hypothetical protein